jgi:2-C-methyl-D-erythritol 4-phosphate cytidylyltransferase
MTSRFFALVPAAGSGARFGVAGPKQYSLLAGKTMLAYSVERLLAAREVEMVFVVLAPGDTEFRRHDWRAFGERLAPLYCGGASRRESVLNGLVACASAVDPNDWMLVHDAARPCLGAPELRRLIDDAGGDEVGGILAVPVSDTLKRADDEGRILETEPRDHLWQAQTPQMFRHGTLLRALREAAQVTDEAAAVEALGYRPKLVEGSTRNLKITFASDLDIAERILAGAEAVK